MTNLARVSPPALSTQAQTSVNPERGRQIGGVATLPPAPQGLPDSLPEPVPVSPAFIIPPLALGLVIVGAMVLGRWLSAALKAEGAAAPVAGVEETGSVIERYAATKMSAAGSDNATLVPAAAAPKAEEEDTTGVPAAAMLEVERAERVERGAVPDFDRIDAVLESGSLLSVPAAWQPDDGATAQSSGEDRGNAVQARDPLLAERMTDEQLAEAQRRAPVWTPPPEP